MKGKASLMAVVDEIGSGGEGGEQESLPPPLLGPKSRRKLGRAAGGGGTHTTPSPSWVLDGRKQQQRQQLSSARKLGACLWEAHSLLGAADVSRREELPLPTSPQLEYLKHTGSSKRRTEASFAPQSNMMEQSTEDLLPSSPTSDCSPMEAITPESSLDLNKRLGESGYSLKTSAELLKILNRIWRLEKQQASSISLVKALKDELNHARSRMQELIQEQEVYHREMDTLMKRVSEDRIIRKKKEQNKIKAAVHSVRTELEDERKMRRRSESLHRKLGKELSEMTSELKKVLNDLERERMSHKLIQDLCDEFATEIGDYSRELQDMRQNHEKGAKHRFGRFILHISEMWLTERMQMKAAEARGDEVEKNTICERLIGKITSFIESRSSCVHEDTNMKRDFSVRRHSVESLHINGAGSAPQDAEDNDSMASDLHCFELKMDANDSENPSNFKLHSKGHTIQFAVHADNIDDSFMGNEKQLSDKLKRINLIADADGFKVQPDTDHRDSCNKFFPSHFAPVCEINPAADSCNIVQQRNCGHASSGLEVSECSSKVPESIKDHSLKEKLLEARLEGKHARMIASGGFSVGGSQK